MQTTDWVFLSLVSGSLLSLILFGITMVVRINTSGQLKRLEKKKRKNKRSTKQIRDEKKELAKQLSNQSKLLIVLLILTLGTGASAGSMNYYAATHLNQQDSESIVKAYYLLEETEKQLLAANQGENQEKAQNNVRQIASGMTGFGIHRASSRLRLSGQQKLNRHYANVKELGMNLSNQSGESFQDDQIFASYIDDLEKIKATQADVFKMFKVNETALKSKK